MERHGAAIPSCRQCGRAFRTKGYYQSTLRSVYGKIRMRVRRIKGCACSGSQGRTYSTLFANKSPITAELRYLTAKMAALLPFGKAADFLGELLPLSAVTAVSTVRDRTMKVGRRLRNAADVLVAAAVAQQTVDPLALSDLTLQQFVPGALMNGCDSLNYRLGDRIARPRLRAVNQSRPQGVSLRWRKVL